MSCVEYWRGSIGAHEGKRARQLRASGLVLDVVDHHAVERQRGKARGELSGGRAYLLVGRAQPGRGGAVKKDRLRRIKKL